MSTIEPHRYDYLRSKRYEINKQDEQFIRPETLAELRQFEIIEFYSRDRLLELSGTGLIKDELKKRIDELMRLRKEHPGGSNPECICMDMIKELIGKLDLEDFRKLRIENIIR